MATNAITKFEDEEHEGDKLIQFRDRKHLDRDDNEMPPGREYLVRGTRATVLHFEGGKVVDEIEYIDGKPDVAALNEKIPRSQWELGHDGEPRPAWVLSWAVLLLDTQDAGLYKHTGTSKGQCVAFKSLQKRINWMQNLRGELIVPIVTLGDELFSRRFKKYRPEFIIKDWRRFKNGPTGAMRLEKPKEPVGEKVEAPAEKDELDDIIPDVA
jgi:hypothetical protein